MGKVFLCCTDIDEVITGSHKVAGIPVFMLMWAKAFYQNGYEVYSISSKEETTLEGIHFIKRSKLSELGKIHLGVFTDFFIYQDLIKRIQPDYVIIHGSSRIHAFLYLLSKRYHFKLIYFGASDVDFVKGQEFLVHGIDKLLFRWALKKTKYIICQNEFQQEKLLSYYSKNSIIIPSIWFLDEGRLFKKTNDFIWVANIKPLKRLEWFVELAARMSSFRFVVIGGIQDYEYFNRIESKMNELSNIKYLGPLPLNRVQDEIARSRILICTSEFEGFPNTFVQAFAENVPVVSTVNPNGIFTKKELGAICESIDDIEFTCRRIISDKNRYKQCQLEISQYFQETHCPSQAFLKLQNYIN